MSLENVSILSFICALLLIPSLIFLVLVISKKSKIMILISLMPIIISVFLIMYFVPSINIANNYLDEINEQKVNYNNFIKDFKYYNDYIHDISNYYLDDNCEYLGGQQCSHLLKINYSALDDDKLVYNFNELITPSFYQYFNNNYKFTMFNNLWLASGKLTILINKQNSFEKEYSAHYFDSKCIYKHIEGNEVLDQIVNYINNDQPKDVEQILAVIDAENFEPEVVYTFMPKYVEDRSFYIGYVILLSIIILINIVNIILVCVLKRQPQINNSKIKQKQEESQKRKWEDLSEEDKKPYIESGIKDLYKNQLQDLELSDKEIKYKKKALETNTFSFEDVTEEYKPYVIKCAKFLYEHNMLEMLQYEKERDKYLSECIKEFYHMVLSHDNLKKLYSIKQLNNINQRLKDNRFVFEDLNEEEQELVLEKVDEKIKKQNQININKANNSTRQKLAIAQFTILGVSIAMTLGFVIMAILQASMVLGVGLFVLGIIGISVSTQLSYRKKQYCPICGTKGVIEDSDTDYNIHTNQNGDIVTDAITVNILKCPHCSNLWAVKRGRRL